MKAKIFYKKCMTKFIGLFLTILNIVLVITRLFGSTKLFSGEDSSGVLAPGAITKAVNSK